MLRVGVVRQARFSYHLHARLPPDHGSKLWVYFLISILAPLTPHGRLGRAKAYAFKILVWSHTYPNLIQSFKISIL